MSGVAADAVSGALADSVAGAVADAMTAGFCHSCAVVGVVVAYCSG